jgi:FtsZ-binding cell division protein ZapB
LSTFFYLYTCPICLIASDKTNVTRDTFTNTLQDREAQRAIRERTKNQIDTLERRIQELTSQQPYQELQSVLRAKEAVEQENADIKRRLAGIVAMLQPIIGQCKFTILPIYAQD